MKTAWNIFQILVLVVFAKAFFSVCMPDDKMPEFSEIIEQEHKHTEQFSIVPQMAKKSTKTEQYIERFKHIALEEEKKYGIPASITLAQGILESKNGMSKLASTDNNHFGIKCKAKCRGCLCRNYPDDSEYDMFRVFPTAWESFREHSLLLVNSPRYASLFRLKKTDYKGWANGLQRCGYATDKRYAKSLIKIIERYRLNQIK